MTTTLELDLTLTGIGDVPVTVTDRGSGRPLLLLHGGAGPQSVADLADRLAAEWHVRVLTPIHPGFGGTHRPDTLASPAGLADLYGALLADLGLADVTVVGNSLGGWVAAELALRHPDRVSDLVLVDAVGLDLPEHPVVDFFSLTMAEVTRLSWHDPAAAPVVADPLPPAVQAVLAGNRAALAAYGGTTMSDPGLRARLAGVRVPTRVLWGESDRIVVPDHGRAYAAAIPGATFQLLPGTGHVPQLETPDQLLAAFTELGR